MTDNEIIKALELCTIQRPMRCNECCYFKLYPCKDFLQAGVLDLINRQKAEIEELEKVEHFADKTIATQQVEIERLKEGCLTFDVCCETCEHLIKSKGGGFVAQCENGHKDFLPFSWETDTKAYYCNQYKPKFKYTTINASDDNTEIVELQRKINELQHENSSCNSEIERLKNEVFAKEQECVDMQEQRDSVEYNLELIKQEKSVVIAEAIKEFAERFMDECLEYPLNDGDLTILVSKRDFDNLVKEKTGTDFTQMFMGTDKLKPLPSIDVKEMVGDNDAK